MEVITPDPPIFGSIVSLRYIHSPTPDSLSYYELLRQGQYCLVNSPRNIRGMIYVQTVPGHTITEPINRMTQKKLLENKKEIVPLEQRLAAEALPGEWIHLEQ